MSNNLILRPKAGDIARREGKSLPEIILRVGKAAETAWDDFFQGKLANRYTRAAYTLAVRRFLAWAMRLVRIRYKANRWKMMVSGTLGIWLHVLLDGIYHYDVQLFWPSKVKELQRPLWRLIGAEELKFLCVIAFAGAVILYLFEIRAFNREKGRGC